MSAYGAVDSGFDFDSGQTNDFKLGIRSFGVQYFKEMV